MPIDVTSNIVCRIQSIRRWHVYPPRGLVPLNSLRQGVLLLSYPLFAFVILDDVAVALMMMGHACQSRVNDFVETRD